MELGITLFALAAIESPASGIPGLRGRDHTAEVRSESIPSVAGLAAFGCVIEGLAERINLNAYVLRVEVVARVAFNAEAFVEAAALNVEDIQETG